MTESSLKTIHVFPSQNSYETNKNSVNESDLVLIPITETILNIFYPVGTIYQTSYEGFDPNVSWGGTWVKIENRFLLGSSEGKVVGTQGGEETHTLTTAEMPSHQHTLGEMNITGDFHYAGGSSDSSSGAFFRNGTSFGYYHGTSGTQYGRIGIDASKTWEGSSSTVGEDKPHNNMPPYEVVNVWKRTA